MGSVVQGSHHPVPVPVVSQCDPVVAAGRSSRAWMVEAAGSVDVLTAAELAGHLGVALAKETALVVVDLRRVDFLAVAGLSVLVAAAQRARARGVTLRVVAGTHAVSRALSVTGLASTLKVCSDLESAMAR